MQVTKLSIFAEIDGCVCHIPSNQFHSVELALNTLSTASNGGTLTAVKMPNGVEFDQINLYSNITETN